MDPFKQFLQENRNALDVESPSDEVWLGIDRKIPTTPKSNVRQIRLLLVAASVSILLGVGIYITRIGLPQVSSEHTVSKSIRQQPPVIVYPSLDSTGVSANPVKREAKNNILYSKTNTPKMLPQTTLPKQPSPKIDAKAPATSTPIEEFEKGFVQLINLQKEKINKTPLNAESPAYFNDFNHEIRMIESDETALKHEIKRHGLTQDLLARLINIYQQKLNVLKQLQIEIQKTNNRFKQKRNPVDTSKVYFLNI